MSVVLPEWYIVDPAKKDKAWADRIITYLRQYMQWVVPQHTAADGMTWLLGTYDMRFVEDMFLDPAKSGVKFIQMAVLEKIRNVIASEIEAAGLHIEAYAVDPTAESQKLKDRELLANRKAIEGLISSLNAKIHKPPYKLENDKGPDGRGMFAGNVEQFDEMGMDDTNNEDLAHFFQLYHRLRHEISAEDAINFYMAFNEVSENFALWVDDILAKKAICARTYVNHVNGNINIKYVAPETVQAIIGRRRDFKDAPAIGITQLVTVQEFLQMVGEEFNMETDMDVLWSATTFAVGHEYTGVHINDRWVCGESSRNMASFAQFMQFKVNVGYIEWKSNDKKTSVGTKKNKHGNPSFVEKPANHKERKNQKYDYKVYSNTDEVTYKAVYLVLSAASQKIYQYGKLMYQNRGDMEGREDEYSNFSISCYLEIGKTAIEAVKRNIIQIEKAFAKLENAIMRALPPGHLYNYESLVQIAKGMFPDDNTQVSIEKVMHMFEQSANKLYTIPQINGQPVGGGQPASIELQNGLSRSVMEFKQIIDWNFEMIYNTLGISPLRQAYAPQPRDVAKLQAQALEYSDKATGYIPRMLMKMLDNVGRRVMCTVQDIVKFKEINKVPYDFMVQALGNATVNDIASLKDVPLHRYGIFIQSFNSFQERQEIKAMTVGAYTNKEITTEQLLLINNIRNPKKAAMVLAYEKRRNERKQQEASAQAHQQAMQLEQAKSQGEMQIQQVKGQLQLQNTQLEGEYKVKVALIEQQGRLAEMQMKPQNDVVKINAKTDGAIRQKEAEVNIDAQKPMPGSGTPAPQPVVPQPPPPMAPPEPMPVPQQAGPAMPLPGMEQGMGMEGGAPPQPGLEVEAGVGMTQ